MAFASSSDGGESGEGAYGGRVGTAHEPDEANEEKDNVVGASDVILNRVARERVEIRESTDVSDDDDDEENTEEHVVDRDRLPIQKLEEAAGDSGNWTREDDSSGSGSRMSTAWDWEDSRPPDFISQYCGF